MGKKKADEKKAVPFPFVKGKVFAGLRIYGRAKTLKVASKKIDYPIQRNFPEIGFDYSSGIMRTLGSFFENLSKGIYGGDFGRTQIVDIENGYNGLSRVISEPDISHSRDHVFREVKSFSPDNSLKFFDPQMEKYAKQQSVPKKIPEIRFELFRHGISKITKKHKMTEAEAMILDLSQNVRFMISMPFSVAYAIYDNSSVPNLLEEHTYPLTSRYEGKGYGWCTQFRPRGINSLLIKPEKTFRDLGLNPRHFKFVSMRFPRGVRINGNKILPFPVLIITERDPYAQFQNLEERVADRSERMKREHSEYRPFFSEEVNGVNDENSEAESPVDFELTD
jgi:hypothetical protein|tara:strand:- start:1372 stop:2379 length:1008 start_codon:yes stop_codon:yes gene_type:complete